MTTPFRVTYSVLDADMAELHKAFDASLATIRGAAAPTFPSWIAGKAWENGDKIESRSPVDRRKVLASFYSASGDAVDRAVAAAKIAQRKWAALTWQDRIARIRKGAEAISRNNMKLAAVMCLEVGKNRLECLGDVEEAADLLRYYAQQVEDAHGFNRPLAKLSPEEDTRDLLRPYGVFAVISPFNFPLALAAGMAGAALLAGNAVILKPSEEAPWCAQGLYDALLEADLPEGLFQVLHGTGEEVGAKLSRHPAIDGIAFTGSTTVGFELHRIMSQGRIRPCFMEMGGKNATIVCDSADLSIAVEGCVKSSFGLSGQKCSALSRIYVARTRHEEFLAKMIERTKNYKVGDPSNVGVDTGPVINAASVARFERACADAKSAGTIHIGGNTLTDGIFEHGTFVSPTIVSVPRGHRLTKDELFLPFVTIEPFDTIDEAITMANDVDYGLSGGIFSQKQAEIEEFMDRIEAGVIYANRKTGATTGAWPGVQSFCGWKASGSSGKGGCGPHYVAQFAREQSQTRMGKVGA